MKNKNFFYINLTLLIIVIVFATNPFGARERISNIAFAAGSWTPSGNNIYFTGGNVGIGITSPRALLHTRVSSVGTTNLSNAVSRAAGWFEGRAAGWFEGNSNSTWGLAIGQDNTTEFPMIQALDRAQTNARNLLINPLGGNVGIGTAVPAQKLEVALGNILVNAGDGLGYFLNDGSGFVRQSPGVGIRANGAERIRIDGGGNVGIGTTNPAAKLEVNGAMKLTPLSADPSGLTNGMMWMRQ
ncbi:MAG: hypothetical protein HYT69_02840 [Candidatus Zambryskibacteria bacterium]|nr:hypothetical protein [Candidatus Zambryskibacteria bacterium]